MSGQEGCTSLPAMILNNRHNFNVSLLSDRLGMLRVPCRKCGAVTAPRLRTYLYKAIAFEQDGMVLEICYN